MLELWAVLIPILLADMVNPVLFAIMVYAAGTRQPLASSVSVLLGHTAAYLIFGIVLGFAYESIAEWLTNPQAVDYGIGLALGVILLWVAWRSRGPGKAQRAETDLGQLTPVKAFGIGAIVNIIGLPFALPYFAALDQILKADLTVTGSLMVLVGYNLGYALPFTVVPGLTIVLGERSRPLLRRINEKVEQVSAFLMPLMLGLVGLVLVVDAVLFFARGAGLF